MTYQTLLLNMVLAMIALKIYHGMGLMIAIAGLIMLGISATESGKL